MNENRKESKNTITIAYFCAKCSSPPSLWSGKISNSKNTLKTKFAQKNSHKSVAVIKVAIGLGFSSKKSYPVRIHHTYVSRAGRSQLVHH